jgi:hypothetical protein
MLRQSQCQPAHAVHAGRVRGNVSGNRFHSERKSPLPQPRREVWISAARDRYPVMARELNRFNVRTFRGCSVTT